MRIWVYTIGAMDKQEQIRKYEEEIASMLKARQILLIIAFIALGVSLNAIVVLIMFRNMTYLGGQALEFFAVNNAIAFPALMIVRSAAFNRRISNRRKAIKKLQSEEPSAGE